MISNQQKKHAKIKTCRLWAEIFDTVKINLPQSGQAVTRQIFVSYCPKVQL
jgi:hypothetical protein